MNGNYCLLEQLKKGAKATLRDRRPFKFSHEGFNGYIWGITTDCEFPSSWKPNGRWIRTEDKESCADIIIREMVLDF